MRKKMNLVAGFSMRAFLKKLGISAMSIAMFSAGATLATSATASASPATIYQNAPLSGSIDTELSAGLSVQLWVDDNFAYGHGGVAFTQATGQQYLNVSSSGLVTSANGLLSPGSYSVTGTDRDTQGNSGVYSFQLVVTSHGIVQSAPSYGSVASSNSAGFTDQLSTSQNVGPVTFVQTTGSSSIVISPTGVVTTTGLLTPGVYHASGTTTDAYGDSGSFLYALDVYGQPGSIIQVGQTSDGVSTADSAAYSTQLVVNGGVSGATFTVTQGSPALHVSSTGGLTTTGTLAAGNYTISGTTDDGYGDSGTFSYTLTVTGVNITESVTTGSVNTTGSSSFTDQLATTGNTSAVTYNQTSGSANVLVSASGAISTVGTLAAGTYTVSGTTSDANGDSGTFSYTLTVRSVALKLLNASGVAASKSSKSFSAQLHAVGNVGSVVFSKIAGNQAIAVSSAGRLKVTSVLKAGVYRITVKIKDAYGDISSAAYVLSVRASR